MPYATSGVLKIKKRNGSPRFFASGDYISILERKKMKAFIRKDILDAGELIPTKEGPFLNTKESMEYVQVDHLDDKEFNAYVVLNDVRYTVKSIDLETIVDKVETESESSPELQLENWEISGIESELKFFSLDDLDIIFNRLAIRLVITAEDAWGRSSVGFNGVLDLLITVNKQRDKMSALVEECKK